MSFIVNKALFSTLENIIKDSIEKNENAIIIPIHMAEHLLKLAKRGNASEETEREAYQIWNSTKNEE